MTSMFHVRLCVVLLLIINTNALDPSDIVIVILGQKEGYHAAHADSLRNGIYEQTNSMETDAPEVILSHELDVNGSWTIVPLLTHLSNNYPKADWFLFSLENTVIRLNKLINMLSKLDPDQELWLGHALYDHEPTIIHHFAEHKKKFKYPHIASGLVMSSGLTHSLAKKLLTGKPQVLDFSIDPSYELANFVLKNTNGVKLTHMSELCVVSGTDCATYPRFFHPCGTVLPKTNVYFAVKTCAKFHTTRIPVIKKTWAKHAANIGYFSDAADQNLPEAYVVPNTTQGHCAKTYAILKKVSRIVKAKNFDWVIIGDDDTIFSVVRLLRLLTCYNPKHAVAIGERYGFRMWDHFHGYDYLTGGAGVVLSAPLVHQMVEPGVCECPTSATPDDMYLFGVCLHKLGVQPTHCPMFHQARPTDYATAYLASHDPISFHKFWMIDPYAVYDEWFAEVDGALSSTREHTEL